VLKQGQQDDDHIRDYARPARHDAMREAALIALQALLFS
jgi:hypothetical protein